MDSSQCGHSARRHHVRQCQGSSQKIRPWNATKLLAVEKRQVLGQAVRQPALRRGCCRRQTTLHVQIGQKSKGTQCGMEPSDVQPQTSQRVTLVVIGASLEEPDVASLPLKLAPPDEYANPAEQLSGECDWPCVSRNGIHFALAAVLDNHLRRASLNPPLVVSRHRQPVLARARTQIDTS